MQTLNRIFLLFLFLLACHSEESVNVQEPKLDYYIDSYDVDNLGFQPQLRVTYEYNSSGLLTRYRVFTYNPDLTYKEERRFDFTYSGDQVNKITGTSLGSAIPYVEYLYEYSLTGRVSVIRETNVRTGINSEANFTYDEVNQSTKVYYSFSNGESFEYEFKIEDGNMVTDKTTKGAQLCSNGEYTYDDHPNPFALGYTDYLLVNLSTNNRLSENTNYVGCAFPTVIPESYTYEYNDRGYPTLITTFYKSGSTIERSQREIFYK